MLWLGAQQELESVCLVSCEKQDVSTLNKSSSVTGSTEYHRSELHGKGKKHDGKVSGRWISVDINGQLNDKAVKNNNTC